MVWVYGLLLAGLIMLLILTGKHNRQLISGLDNKEHRLKPIYPAASFLADLFLRYYPAGKSGHLGFLLRSMYVKENVEREKYIYVVKKTAVIITVFAGGMILGLFSSLSDIKDTGISRLERRGYGQGTDHYELEAEYRGNEERVELDVEPVHLRESEILELFENSYEEVRQIMLGENISQDHVTGPLDLISSYKGFDIYWSIDDTSAVDYNGDIKVQLSEGDSIVVNFFAEFSMDGVSETYTIPVNIEGMDPEGSVKLINDIRDETDRINDIYSKDVYLPEEIDGYGITFRTEHDDNSFIFIILAAAAVVFVLIFYDRRLEEKVKKRQEQMMQDFTEIVSKLSLLYDAGLSIHGAFERIVADHEQKQISGKGKEIRYAYGEMKLALEKIRSGVSETEAYAQFGKRCGLYQYIKLGNILEQNLSKGTKGMKVLLRQEVSEAFEERKRQARKKGEEAGTKLLLPMILMLMVVIAIIAVPALMSMNY